MTKGVGDEHTPLRKALNTSGVPFQLRVERLLRGIQEQFAISSILREVPSGDRFTDLVCRIEPALLVLECKRYLETDWLFVMSDGERANETRCYFDYVADSAWIQGGRRRTAMRAWNLVVGCPEAEFCITPKDNNKLAGSLEAVSRVLVSSARELLETSPGLFGTGDELPVVPIIVTTARLWTCIVRQGDVDLDTGTLAEGKGGFSRVTMVRFTKTLSLPDLNEQNVDYLSADDLETWADELKRTVFVINPAGLPDLFAGFRSFTPLR